MDPPHAPLQSYYPGEPQRRQWVRDIFSRTAGDYDRVERAMAIGTGSAYRRRALINAGLQHGMVVVDVGVGTGLVACEAAAIVGDPTRVTGVDPSPGMLEHAQVPAGVRLLAGSAEHIPLADGSADFISMGYALRHLDDLATAFAEFQRVLRAGGMLCILEITVPPTPLARWALKTYMRRFVPWLASRLSKHRDTPELMRYHWDTIEACIAPGAVLDAMRRAGFVNLSRDVEVGIFSAYRGLKLPVAGQSVP